MLVVPTCSEVDADRYPQVAAYIGRLPEGLGSYPECRAKGSLIASALEGHDVADLGDGLPDAIAAMLRRPPASGLWVAAPLSDAVFYLLADVFYPTEDAVMQWTRERTLRTANSRLYRAISRVTRPGTLLRMAAAAHGLFQRGTELSATYSDAEATLQLTHPPHLHGGLNHRSNVPMFEALLAHTGAERVQVALTHSSDTEATYHGTWQT